MQEKLTIRDIISDYQNEIKNTDLQPDRAANILTELSSIYGNVLDEVKKRQIIYNKVLLKVYDTEKKANRAKLKAETTLEYSDFLEARNTERLTLEMIRSLKYYLRAKESEYREAT